MGDLFTSTDQVLPATAAAPPMPALQRRYSVTGQTPPDHAAAAKSPKLQGLDTSVPTGNCNLCESCGRNNGRSDFLCRDRTRSLNKRTGGRRPNELLPSCLSPPRRLRRTCLPRLRNWASITGTTTTTPVYPTRCPTRMDGSCRMCPRSLQRRCRPTADAPGIGTRRWWRGYLRG